MRVELTALEEQLERFGGAALRGEMPRQRQPRAPVLRVRRRSAGGTARRSVPAPPTFAYAASSRENARYARSGDVLDQPLPGRDRARDVALRRPDVAEIQVRRCVLRIELDGRLEPPRRLRVVRSASAPPARSRFRERPRISWCRAGGRLVAARGELLPHRVGFGPLVLFLVQLLEVRQRVLVARDRAAALPRTPRARDRRSRRACSRARGRAARSRVRACADAGAAAAPDAPGSRARPGPSPDTGCRESGESRADRRRCAAALLSSSIAGSIWLATRKFRPSM